MSPPLDVNLLRVFHQVLRTGSFAAAGRALSLSRQAVAEQVARLEEALGARLLERTTRSLRPTELGRVVGRRAEAVTLEVADLIAEIEGARSEPSGTLRVSVPGAFGRQFLPAILARLRARHPGLRIEAHVSDRFVDLFDEDIDVAVRVGSPRDTRLVGRVIGRERLVVVASPSLHTAKRAIDVPDLAALPIVGTAPEETWELPSGPVQVHPAVVLNDLEAVRNAAIHGLGLARLPSFAVAEALARGELTHLWTCTGAPREVWVVYPSRRHLTAKVQCFVREVAEHAQRVFVAG